MAAVGGAGLIEQMRALDPTGSTSSCASTARTTSRCTRRSRRAPGILDVLPQLRRRGPAARHRHREAPRDRRSSRSTRCPQLEPLFDVVVGERRHRAPQAGPGAAPARARRCSAPTPAEAAYVGDSPFDVRAGEGGRRCTPSPSTWGGIHPRGAAARRGAGRARPRRGGAACRPLTRRRRARVAELRERARAPPLPLPRPRRPGDLGRRVRPALRRARAARGGASRSSSTPTRRRSASARRPPSGSEGRAPAADGLAREGDDRRGAAEVGATTCASGSARDEPVAYVIEPKIDGLGDQPRLRGRRLRARRHARRRRAGRGRDREPAHDPVDPAAHASATTAPPAARGARRGLHAALRLPRAQRAARGRRQEDGAEPAQRGGRLAAAEGLVDHGRAGRSPSGSTASGEREGLDARVAVGDARVAARARLPHEPVRRAPRVDRGGRRGVRASGSGAGSSSTTRSTAS